MDPQPSAVAEVVEPREPLGKQAHSPELPVDPSADRGPTDHRLRAAPPDSSDRAPDLPTPHLSPHWHTCESPPEPYRAPARKALSTFEEGHPADLLLVTQPPWRCRTGSKRRRLQKPKERRNRSQNSNEEAADLVVGLKKVERDRLPHEADLTAATSMLKLTNTKPESQV